MNTFTELSDYFFSVNVFFFFIVKSNFKENPAKFVDTKDAAITLKLNIIIRNKIPS